MNDNKTAIKLENVSKRFNVYSRNIDRILGVVFGRKPAEVKHALKDISLEIKKGEHVVVFGIVDSGRSTLLKVISDITKPSKGNVMVDGRVNTMLDARVGIDMEFSCRENIYMKANLVGMKRSEIEPHVDEILKLAEIEKYADIPMKRAPKGTAAILSAAVHLCKDSDIVLSDEVFGGGGNYISTKCEERLIDYLKARPESASVTVTTKLAFAKKVGTRFLVIDEGAIVYDGNADEAWNMLMEISRSRGK